MKKKDSEVISTSSGTSRGSDHPKGSFSLRRIFHARRGQSKSHVSLDSESARSESSLTSSGQNDAAAASTSSAAASNRAPFISASQSSQRKSDNMRECPVCLTEQALENFPDIMTCHHRSCRDCLRQYLQIEITESRVNIACPECAEKFHPNDIGMILQEPTLMHKYEEFMLRRVLAMDPDARWCPAPDCGFAVIATGCAGCPKLKCERPGCDTYFCYHCKQYWHPNQTCDAARAERSPNIRSASISYSHESSSQNDIKPCPRCGAFIVKMNDGSCNHMTCAVCGAEFCWLCMKEISDLHYLSPSGCTFWGKKPWSRKKKILWQLGTLVGAPVGITLVAGIAVPAMIIGIPVWVGRKIHSRYEGASRHKRNLAITGGVAASVLVSPIIAGLAVGIGVPILLAYVYGVVPISLCRSGGCGVTTTNTGGVRFEFDEDNEASHGNYGNGGDNHSVETSQHVANPSIAPSIGEASVGMTNSLSASGSHMDRVGVLRDESDRDSASNRAIASCSLNGSLCGSTYASVTGFQNKLEVQVDVSANPSSSKRASFSSESANVSLSERSATVMFGDDASTKALAGSIISSKDKDGVSLSSPPVEVHGDISTRAACCQHCTDATHRCPSPHDSTDSTTPSEELPGITSPYLRRSASNSSVDSKARSSKCKKCTRFIDIDQVYDQEGKLTSAPVVGCEKREVVTVLGEVHLEECVSKREPLKMRRSNAIFTHESVTSDTNATKNVDLNYGKQPASSSSLCEEKTQSDSPATKKLTEVEPDKPSLEGSSDGQFKPKGSAQGSHSCMALVSESAEQLLPSQAPQQNEQGLRRRHSCELAMQNGRISLQ